MNATLVTESNRPVYYVPEWMKNLLEGCVNTGLARRLTNAEPPPSWSRLKEGEVWHFPVQKGNVHWDEWSKEKEVIIWDAEFEKIRDFAYPRLGNDGAELLRLAEEYLRERDDREALGTHKCLVQLIIARGVELSMVSRPNETVHLNGNFDLIGRFPVGSKVEVHGNVGTIEGSIGSFLKVVGNVKHLGCGPFWAESPMKGDESCKLEIHGDLEGYKSSIENKQLEIEIFGSVTTKGQFLRGSNFRKLTIHGDVSANTPFAGLFTGTIVVLGRITDMDWATRDRWLNTSAGRYGHGDIFLKDRQLVANGKLIAG